MSLTLRVLLGFAAAGLVLFFMREAASMINALILSAIIVLSAAPLLYWLKSRGVPDWLSFTITLITIFIAFALLVVLLIVGVNRLIESIPTYASEFQDTLDTVDEFLSSLGVEELDIALLNRRLDSSKFIDFLMGFLGGLVDAVSNVVLIGLIIIFLLVDAFGLPGKLSREIDAGNLYVKRVSEFAGDIREYVSITTVVGLITGVLDTIWFILLGVDFPLLWGILAFLLSYIPTIGFWLAAIPPTILALLESGPVVAIIVFLGIVLINGFAENVVKPKYMGRGLDLSPFIVVFSVVFWSAILGPLGAILSIPMTLVVKELILEMDEQNSWIARMMGSGEEDQPASEPRPGQESKEEPTTAAGQESV
jgi:predicted PurR-regulated permease PerM